jgi:phage terminase large subunit-like protein
MGKSAEARRPVGRPALSDAERARRGTLRPDRVRDATALPDEQLPVEVSSSRDYVGEAHGYVRGVLGGAITACRWVQLACERHERDAMRAATDPDCPFIWDAARATEACLFIEQLPHVEGKWTTSNITLQPSQVFLVVSLFGWRQRDDPTLRRFTTLYLELGRKGAKSTLMAAIAFFHLLREGEVGASVVCGATTGTQARIVFGIMQRMVRASPWLRAQGVEALANAIVTVDGTAKPINAKASTQDGLNPSCIVLDESHAQKFGLHDVLKSAQGARPNPLLLAPTTAGYDLLSVGYALRTHLTKVLQQVFVADHLFGLIYTLDDTDDWRDSKVWVKANPMLGITPKLDWVAKYCLDAQQTPGIEGEFRVKVCSQWMQSSSSWLSMTAWDACADPTLTLERFKGKPCWIGNDLAQLDDLAAKALVFEEDGIVYGFVQFYLPRDVVEARARVEPAYKQWALDEVLTLTDGAMIDNAVIEADIRADCKRFQVKAIVFDQFGSADLGARLAKDGLPAVIEPKNAKTFTPPARELETRVNHRRFRHNGNACLKWNASNCVVNRRTDDSILPKKEGPESPNKIDGIDALLEAIGAMLRKPAAPAFRMLVLGGGR